MQVILTNLSNKLFKDSRDLLNISAIEAGINKIYSYDFEDIIYSEFFKRNESILSQPKGLGYWLWKPYIILEASKKINEDDIVFYSDCGINIIKHLQPLIDICNNEADIMLFANSNYTNRIWTKRDCFILMDCDEEKYWNGVHCDAAFMLFRKTSHSIQFLEEWLLFGRNENIITDIPNICGEENLPEFVDHRRDQSIISLLAIKYGVEFYRMPTQFGNHYKLPEFRVEGEFNCINQGDQTQLDFYSKDFFSNSNYPQLLNHHRNKSSAKSGIHKNMTNNSNYISKIKYYVNAGVKRVIHSVKSMSILDGDEHQKKSYSQCGEDLLVQYIFNLRGIYRPSYIDIGANDPFFLSNTALFYKQGCRGINIDANLQLAAKFRKYRPDDINLNIGISDKEEELDFYVMVDDTLSTFSKEECDYLISTGKTLSKIERVTLTTLTKILDQYNNGVFPDFLSIDVEGLDFQILKSINFNKSYPKIICVEATEYSPVGSGARRNDLIDFLVSNGYYEYANTNLNAIMVRRDFWFV